MDIDMSNELSTTAASTFERIKRVNERGGEYWSARELAKVLEYSDFRNFLSVINKARQACTNSERPVADHFVDITEMVGIGSGAWRPIEDWALSRYACYLIIQNADPSKPLVALGQSYFAIQTRRQELADDEALKEDERRLLLRKEMRKHNKQLASTAKDAGVAAPQDYAIFMDHGFKGLYGGLSMQEVHKRKRLNPKEQILDHMCASELAANLFRATQTEEKLRREKVRTKQAANRAHEEVGRKVRKTISELGGIMPEDLPIPAPIKEVEGRQRKRIKGQQP
jgi:DNA-damage-inducible protein D